MRGLRPAVSMAASLLWLAACSYGGRTSNSAASPGAVQRGVPSKPKAVTSTPTSSPTPPQVVTTPVPPGTKSVSPLPSPHIRVPRLPADAAPQILSVAMSETTVHAGDRISGSVVTTSNVASVEARIGGYSMSLPKSGVGRFTLTYTVAPLPWFIRGNFTMQVIARNPRGDMVTRAIPLTVR